MKWLILIWTMMLSAPTLAEGTRPNILFIMADDLGKEWLGCYGSEEHVTPHIDRLAESGMRFENVYATPLCTPTRHVLLTGRYPFRTGWTVHHDSPRWGGRHLDPKREITSALMLRDAGYATAIAGKWQINDLRVDPDILDKHGFDEHCMWVGYETGNPPSAERYDNPFIQHNGERKTHEGAFGPDVFTDFLIDFMTRHRDEPFLAYYPMVLTHTPFTTTPHNRETDKEKIALHPGMVGYADHLVGRLVETLDKLELRRRTIVIFTTDNGTVGGVKGRMRGQLINGGKAKLTEAGICVPFIASCPGAVPAGKVSDALVDFSDLLPTFTHLAGAKIPSELTLDGRSFADLLTGKDERQERRNWIFSQLGKNRVIRDKRFKLWSDGRFYDLIDDPLEEKNLASSDVPQVVKAREQLTTILQSLPPDAELPWPPYQRESK